MNKIYVLYNGSEYLINLDFIESVYYNYKEPNKQHTLKVTMASGTVLTFDTVNLNNEHKEKTEAILNLWKELIK